MINIAILKSKKMISADKTTKMPYMENAATKYIAVTKADWGSLAASLDCTLRSHAKKTYNKNHAMMMST